MTGIVGAITMFHDVSWSQECQVAKWMVIAQLVRQYLLSAKMGKVEEVILERKSY